MSRDKELYLNLAQIRNTNYKVLILFHYTSSNEPFPYLSNARRKSKHITLTCLPSKTDLWLNMKILLPKIRVAVISFILGSMCAGFFSVPVNSFSCLQPGKCCDNLHHKLITQKAPDGNIKKGSMIYAVI